MNASEGLKRIATAVRWLGYGAGALCFVAGVGIGIWLEPQNAWGLALFFAFGGAFLVGSGWVIAWIIEGFAKARDNGSA